MITKQKKIVISIISVSAIAALGIAVFLSGKGFSMYDIFYDEEPAPIEKKEEKKTDKKEEVEEYTDDEPTEEMPQMPKPEETSEVEGASEGDPQPQPAPRPEQTANWWDYPANIVQIPIAQVSHLSVVDKGHQLPSNYTPTDLVTLTAMPGLRVKSGMSVRSIIVEPLRQLGAQAQADGIDLVIISSFRSYQTQESTYNYWVSYNGGDTNVADQISARPGHSEHQLGTVVDFSTNEIGDAIGAQFTNTKAANWLLQNAPNYGFRLSYPVGQEQITGYAHESWHWRWWGN